MISPYLMKPTRELREVLDASQRRSVKTVGRSIRTVKDVLAARCPECSGTGFSPTLVNPDNGEISIERCHACQGTGWRKEAK